jgi:hypothetical protein
MSELPPAEDPLVGFMRFAGARAAQQIMREHRAGRDGKCPVCRSDGASSGHVVAPCNLYLAAVVVREEALAEADRKHVERVTGAPVVVMKTVMRPPPPGAGVA